MDEEVRGLERTFDAAPDSSNAGRLVAAYGRIGLLSRDRMMRLVACHRVLGVFIITETPDSFILHNVPHCRNIDGSPNSMAQVTIEWSKNLQTVRHDQDEWSTILKKDSWELPDSQIIYSTLRAFYLFPDELKKEAGAKAYALLVNTLSVIGFRVPGVLTGSRVMCNSSGTDTVIHRYGTPYNYAVSATIARPNIDVRLQGEYNVGGQPAGCVPISNQVADIIEALLGTNDAQQVNQVLSMIAKEHTLWRPLMKRDAQVVVIFGLHIERRGNSFELWAWSTTRGDWPTIGVRFLL